eukprot:TRINITY_DN3909_c0_g1_i1.p1 TRINITY_DN3909_c0_g1~~TRINITY_DN3909_c0_g1_i1.p1  ORF type:complete len:165 (-),score=7.20 TRINITY_DN3909_c0_g1_i1:149-643(-)
MVLGGGMVAIGAVIAERNGWDFTPLIFGQMEEELIYAPFICGVMSGVTAFVGCCGARTRARCGKCMLIIYAILVFLTLILPTASAAQAMADKSNIYKYAQRQWDTLTMTEEKIFEWDHFCCNFDTLDPCCRFTYGEGECTNEYICFDKVRPHLVAQFNTIITAQ